MAYKAIEWVRLLRGVTPTQKLLLFVLADRVKDGEWTTWVGQDAIADETGVALRTVQRTMPELERLGLIEREHRRRPDGYRTSDVIRLNVGGEPTSPAELSPDAKSPDNLAGRHDQDIPNGSHPTDCHPTESHVTSTTTSPANDGASYPTQWRSGDRKLEPGSRTSTSSRARSTGDGSVIDIALRAADSDSGFDRFWAAYPLHTGEKSARRSWYQAVGKASPEEILAGVDRYIRSGRFSEPRFAIEPSKWLFEERWNDNYRPDDGGRSEWCNTVGNRTTNDLAKLGLERVNGELRPIGARNTA